MQCWLCPNLLEGKNRTGEHIIPSAIGGHKEVCDFICRECNSKRGIKWEAEVARQFLWFSSASGVKRGRGGKHPDLLVSTASGEKLKLRADTVLIPAEHKIEIEESDEKIKISIQSNDKETNKNLIRKVARDYPDFNFEKAVRDMETVDSYPNHLLSMSFTYGGPDAGRSMVKSCLALLSDAGIQPEACGRALAYLNDPSPDAIPPFCLFFDVDLIAERPTDYLFHCVSVIGQPHERRILGYVEFYNFARILVHISDDYEGAAFQETYAIDPVEARELDLRVDFGDIQSNIYDHFTRPKDPPQMFLDALQCTGNIVNRIISDRVRDMAISKAATDALKALGLHPHSEDIPSELKEKWMSHFIKNLRPYIESQIAKIAIGN